MSSGPGVSPQRNQGYDLLRIVAILGVVAIHTFGPTAANQEIEGTPTWWIARTLAIGSIFSVPVFVMLSGALNLTERAHADGPRAFYARRARRVLPALVAWNFIYLVLIRMVLFREHLSGGQIVVALVTSTVYPHLYFLWLIVGIYLVSPILRAFLAGGGARRAAWLAASLLGFTLIVFMVPRLPWLSGAVPPLQLGALTFWLAYVGYFVTGYALSVCTAPRRWVRLSVVGLVVLGAGTVVQSAFPDRFPLLAAVSPVEHLGMIVAVYSIAVFVVGVRWLARADLSPRLARLVVELSDASFGVFLVHLIVLLLPYHFLEGFHAHRSLPEALLAYAVIVIVSFTVVIVARKTAFVKMIV